METTAEGWSPLRWCLGVAPTVSFANGDVGLDLSLANEDVLSTAQYEASVAVVGAGRWQRTVEVPIEGGCLVRGAGFVDGMDRPGLMDWRYYGQVLPRQLLNGEAEDVAAFAVSIGPWPGGHASGLLEASFRQAAASSPAPSICRTILALSPSQTG